MGHSAAYWLVPERGHIHCHCCASAMLWTDAVPLWEVDPAKGELPHQGRLHCLHQDSTCSPSGLATAQQHRGPAEALGCCPAGV